MSQNFSAANHPVPAAEQGETEPPVVYSCNDSTGDQEVTMRFAKPPDPDAQAQACLVAVRPDLPPAVADDGVNYLEVFKGGSPFLTVAAVGALVLHRLLKGTSRT